MKRKAFTLIELLVVIAIIALLLSIIIPSLKSAKELASGAVCMSNQKNLSLSWISYAEDNDSYLVGGSNYYSGARSTPYRWVEYPLFSDTDIPETSARVPQNDYSLEYRKNGIRAGRLFDYTGDVDLYHCPGDKTMVKNPEPQGVFRSYEITGLMNGEDFIRRRNGLYSPIEVFRKAITTPGGSMKDLKVALKTTDIRSPGNKLVFVEYTVNNSRKAGVKQSGIADNSQHFSRMIKNRQPRPDAWRCPHAHQQFSHLVGRLES